LYQSLIKHYGEHNIYKIRKIIEYTRTEEFKNKYGTKVLKDENGEPVLLYHGGSRIIKKFLPS
jgi:hypothetical protein